MRVSVGLPVHRIDLGDEFVSGAAIGECARAAEEAGFYAVAVTDHPFPGDRWLTHGGHHALDPFSSLAFAAATTSTVMLHTNLLVVSYRNPWIAAHQVATLDRLSGGRVLLGVGAGYLEAEFDAMGIPFEGRNERTDEGIRIMKRAWTGESIDGNTMAPTPVRPGGPPIWIGGNTKRAVRRAVDLADGWSPFPSGTGKAAERTRTRPLNTPADLAEAIAYAKEYAAEVGRTAPLDVVFMPLSLTMIGHDLSWEPNKIVDEVHELVDVGMTAMAIMLPAESRSEFKDQLVRFSEDVLQKLPA